MGGFVLIQEAMGLGSVFCISMCSNLYNQNRQQKSNICVQSFLFEFSDANWYNYGETAAAGRRPMKDSSIATGRLLCLIIYMSAGRPYSHWLGHVYYHKFHSPIVYEPPPE